MKERNRPHSLALLQADGKAHQLNQLQSSESHNRKKTFITTILASQKQPTPQLQEVYQQLNSVIDGMDLKIQDVINRHEAEFLLAYRNHMKKVKHELEEIRTKMSNAQANSHSFDKISALEKQLVLFRGQALKLYDDLEDKNLQCEKYKLQLEQVNSHNVFLENEVKKLMKRTKYLEVEFQNASRRSLIPSQTQTQQAEAVKGVSPFQIRICSQNTVVPANRRTLSRKIRTAQSNRISEASAFAHVDKLRQVVSNDNVFNNIKEVIASVQEIRNKKMEALSAKYARIVKISNSQSTRTSQLEEFFLRCVEVVRKEVLRRKNAEMTYIPQTIDYESFKKMDCMKVLELLVTHDQVKIAVYNELFSKVVPSTSTMHRRTERTKSSRLNTQSYYSSHNPMKESSSQRM